LIWINTVTDLRCEQRMYTRRILFVPIGEEDVMRTVKLLLAGIAMVVATAATSQAAPMPTHLAAIKAATSSDTVQVRWGGGGRVGGWHGGGGGWRGGGGWGHGGWAHGGWGHRGYGWGAVAAGALIGGAIVNGGYYGSYPAYDEGYAYEGGYGSGYAYQGGYAQEGCYPDGGYGHGGYSRVYYGNPYRGGYGW
jgi:hypothetical protein